MVVLGLCLKWEILEQFTWEKVNDNRTFWPRRPLSSVRLSSELKWGGHRGLLHLLDSLTDEGGLCGQNALLSLTFYYT